MLTHQQQQTPHHNHHGMLQSALSHFGSAAFSPFQMCAEEIARKRRESINESARVCMNERLNDCMVGQLLRAPACHLVPMVDPPACSSSAIVPLCFFFAMQKVGPCRRVEILPRSALAIVDAARGQVGREAPPHNLPHNLAHAQSTIIYK